MRRSDLYESIGRIEGKLDHVAEDMTEVKGTVTALDERVRTVERKSALNSAVISGTVAVGISLLSSKLKLLFA
jgi:hypothetical protein